MTEKSDKEELELLKSILNQLPGNIYWKDKEGKMLGCNYNNANLFNLTPDLMIGRSNNDVLSNHIAGPINEIDRQVMAEEKTVMLEEVGPNFEGKNTRYLSYKAPLRDQEGNVIGVIGTSLDIEDYKQKESALIKQQEQLETSLKQVINVMPGNVYWKNEQGRYLGCNDNVANVLGLTSPKDIIGKRDIDLMNPNLAKQVQSIDAKIMSSGELLTVEESGLNDAGEHATYFTQKVPLRDNTGKTFGLLGVSLDITQRKQMEHDLQAAKEQAEFSSQSKTDMILNMSHDLRTPCANILGLANLMKKKQTSAETQEEIKSIIESSESLLILLDEILASAKLTETDTLIVNDYFNIKDVIRDAVNLIKPNMIEKRLQYHIDTSQIQESELIGDKSKLYRIIINLLSNAVKFTASGNINLIATQRKGHDHTSGISIEVHDTGIGIAEDKIKYIFEKFNRINPAYEGIYKGTGVGLFIVKKFTDLMGGSITVESEQGSGSIFRITIPFQQILKQKTAQQHNILTDFSNLKVLIVEDNAIAKKITEDIIKEFGCKIELAENATKALAHNLAEYDLIIMDVGLPDMDGYQLATKIKTTLIDQSPLIVGLTAHATLNKPNDNHIDTMFTKPLTLETGRFMLEKALEYQKNKAN